MSLRLEDKVAVITGSGSGIGRAAALKFAREGARVLVADINDAAGAETADMLGESGAFLHTDVADQAQVEAAIARAVELWGRLDVMINNAATGSYKGLLDYAPGDFERVVQINQTAVFYGILAAGRRLRDQGTGGVIINTVSVFAFQASPKLFSYHATKSAVRMMTQSAALELAPHNIRVVAVAPGTVDTPFIDGYKKRGKGELLAKNQMRGAILTPEHVANVMAFVASDEADGINGSTVMVDDGFIAFK